MKCNLRTIFVLRRNAHVEFTTTRWQNMPKYYYVINRRLTVRSYDIMNIIGRTNKRNLTVVRVGIVIIYLFFFNSQIGTFEDVISDESLL